MEAEAGANSVGWSEVTSEELAAAIRATLAVEVDGDFDLYKWICPRCKHDAANSYRREGYSLEDLADGVKRIVTLTCGCGAEHADQPDDNPWPGCGCYATARIEVPEQ